MNEALCCPGLAVWSNPRALYLWQAAPQISSQRVQSGPLHIDSTACVYVRLGLLLFFLLQDKVSCRCTGGRDRLKGVDGQKSWAAALRWVAGAARRSTTSTAGTKAVGGTTCQSVWSSSAAQSTLFKLAQPGARGGGDGDRAPHERARRKSMAAEWECRREEPLWLRYSFHL